MSKPLLVTEYFTGLADVYDAHRPTYPAAAIDFIVSDLTPPIHAADVGCGTGIASRLLAARSIHVVGIDPNRDMLERARRAGSPVNNLIEYRYGTGEATGLERSCVDLVICAQSFHWFDAAAALAEFHRILRPGGRLALVWNVKDRADSFTAGFCAVAERAQHDAAQRGLAVPPDRSADPSSEYFEIIDRAAFPNVQQLDLQGVLARAHSASYFPREGPLREQLDNDLRCLFEQHQRDQHVQLMYRTEVTLAKQRSEPQT